MKLRIAHLLKVKFNSTYY